MAGKAQIAPALRPLVPKMMEPKPPARRMVSP
jgi:hypothetical protein